jgi:hypothetical protein
MRLFNVMAISFISPTLRALYFEQKYPGVTHRGKLTHNKALRLRNSFNDCIDYETHTEGHCIFVEVRD